MPMVREDSLAARCISRTKLVPAAKSHACRVVGMPFSSRIQATHFAQASSTEE